MGALALLCAQPALGQDNGAPSAPAVQSEQPYEGRPIASIRFEGLQRVTESLARNQLRTVEGRPLAWSIVQDDLRRLERIGEFRDLRALVEPQDDNSVVVVFHVAEAPIVHDVVVVGNREISDEDIALTVSETTRLITGVPIDDYRIAQAARAIERLYRERGFSQVNVTIDESELAETGVVLFRVREGERMQVTALRFSGNKNFTSRRLRALVKTKEAGLFTRAPLDNTTLDEDVGTIARFYRERGYFDARVSRSILPAPNGREAILTFVIEEGTAYRLRDVVVESTGREPLRVLSAEQVRGLMALTTGEVVIASEVRRSADRVRDALLQMGYIDAVITPQERRTPNEGEVDLLVGVFEGDRFKTGLVLTQGNALTKSKVIRREVDLLPDHWLDGTAIQETERQLVQRGLFAPPDPRQGSPGPSVTVQAEDPAFPGYRDVLVEVEETNTARISFGASISSDAGVSGGVSLTQRNFDLADTPDSLSEFLRGRAFRGAGQTFDVTLNPGNQVSTYSISLAEPALFESDYSASAALFFRQRVFRDYDEDRYGLRGRLGRRFGTRWSGAISFRAESITLNNIEDSAPVDYFDVENEHRLTGIGVEFARTTADNRFRPTGGTRTELSLEQVGALGGDYNFTKLEGLFSIFIPLAEDELTGTTLLTLTTRAGYIPQDNEAPVYERYFMGGRTFRGFNFRGMGPIGVRNDTAGPSDVKVGGDWMFFAGAEYEKPLWEQTLAGVLFVDSGTIADEPGFEDYRISAGLGVRLYLPQFGQAPLAFDFAFPVSSENTDDEEIFSFSFDLPF
ncbi:MAG: outer membrane protein assembly factor BamA [Phycisphaerales bacterium]|nr:outer membrane protein assembly factor BamA [Phycisphaerales bacterium]